MNAARPVSEDQKPQHQQHGGPGVDILVAAQRQPSERARQRQNEREKAVDGDAPNLPGERRRVAVRVFDTVDQHQPDAR